MSQHQRNISNSGVGIRPSSVQLEQLQARQRMHQRPLSEQYPAYTNQSSEAQAIDKWFEDLSYYERTLEEMSITTLDDTFKEELSAIENWFRVLSDPERTACLYSLLKGTTPLQIKFFITVLTQMAQKDSTIDPLAHSILRSPTGRPASTATRPSSMASNPAEEIGRLFARPNSQRLSSEFNIRNHTLLQSTSQEDFSDDALSTTSRHNVNNSLHHSRNRSSGNGNFFADEQQVLSSEWQPKVRSSSILDQPKQSMIDQQKQLPKQIPSAQLPPRAPFEKSPTSPPITTNAPYSQMAKQPLLPSSTAIAAETPNIAPRQIGRSLPRSEDEWDSHGHTISRPREKSSNDSIDINEIQDIPTWFRSLRLHKYTSIFENDDWRNIIRLTEEELVERGVAALGARRKMLKVFEAARNELHAKKIPF